MKKNKLTLIITLASLTLWCTPILLQNQHIQLERKIASVAHSESEITNYLKTKFENNLQFVLYESKFEFVLNPTKNVSDNYFDITSQTVDGQLKFILSYSDNIRLKTLDSELLEAKIQQLLAGPAVQIETYMNYHAGSKKAQLMIIDNELTLYKFLLDRYQGNNVVQYAQEDIQELTNRIANPNLDADMRKLFEEQIRMHQQTIVFAETFPAEIENRTKAIEQQFRGELKKLSKTQKLANQLAESFAIVQEQLEKENLKLDDYIARNDRESVSKLIQSYLPWQEMEPTERTAWTKWLKAIEKKSNPDSEKILTFRGLSSDLVRESVDGGHFLMSTMLTKNQGNYTRRLRTFKTQAGKIFKDRAGKKFMYKGISDFTIQHQLNPAASSFLSAAVLDVAKQFSLFSNKNNEFKVRIAAIHIDKERVFYNILNEFNEKEILIPLIVFPDEVLDFYEADLGKFSDLQNLNHTKTSKINEFIQQVENKLGRKLDLSEIKPEKSFPDQARNTKKFFEIFDPRSFNASDAPINCKKALEALIN